MSGKTSKKLSGAQNRKRRLQREESEHKLAGSLNKFLTTGTVPPAATVKKQRTESFDEASNSSTSLAKDNTGIYNEEDETSLTITMSPEVSGKEILNSATDKPETSNFCLNFNVNDPGTWPKQVTIKIRDSLVENCPRQTFNKDFPKDKSGRKFSESYYYRTLQNGERITRSYLVYSESQNSVFCYHCKLFGEQNAQLTNEYGCNDWKHLSHILRKHETSSSHIANGSKYSELKMSLSNKCTIDSTEQRLYETEKKYWQSVIERLIYIIQYLARQCLAFRGSSNNLFDNDNGNFLKLVETVAKFDPIMAEHLHRIQTSHKKSVAHYLGDKIQNEVIHIIAEAIRQKILEMVKESKYYSLILDTTPDLSHIEQLTIVIRFVYRNKYSNIAKIREHFLGFQSVDDTTG